ncbi:MAG: shikimate kinase [Candidatus Binataceae bacterium]
MAAKVILTGFMATGKSAVGRAVATRLGRRFIDTDHEIVTRAGKPIARIFAEDGEAAFRRLEREVIATVAQAPQPAVIATGGGALVDDANFAALSQAGTIVCLVARPEVIARRVSISNIARPKLAEGNLPLEQKIVEMMEARQSAYARAAIAIDTSDLTIDAAAERVLRALENKRVE